MGKMDRMVSNFRYANRTNQTLYKTLLFGYKTAKERQEMLKQTKKNYKTRLKH